MTTRGKKGFKTFLNPHKSDICLKVSLLGSLNVALKRNLRVSELFLLLFFLISRVPSWLLQQHNYM